MNAPNPESVTPVSSEQTLAALIEQLTDRAQAGEALDPEALAQQHPEHAEDLRRLLPALQGLITPGVLGDFRLLHVVGRGGMGVVYEAEQISLRRRVALKVLPFVATMDPRQLQRFRNESLAAASLEHPHIVPVYGVGCERGTHYYAMKLIDGRSLETLLQQLRAGGRDYRPGGAPRAPTDSTTNEANGQPSAPSGPLADATAEPKGPPAAGELASFRQVALWGIQAAEALEYAHSMGVVHRDVKPANLLIDGQGQLWVADFGLARTAADAGLTMTGDLLGTPRYMSPEQALARHNLVDHRTDVYALGVTLYELLTLRPAFDGKDRGEVLHQIASEEPKPPRRLNPRVPLDLETVVLKAMAKEPTERYATARDLADDLARFLAGEPIKARPVGRLERAVRWCRRYPTVATLLAVLALLIVVAGSLITWQWRTALTALARAESEQRRRALAQVNALRDAAPDAVPGILDDLAENAEEVLPRLRELYAEGGDRARRMRLALALIPLEPEAVRDDLAGWMLQAENPAEVLLARKALEPHATGLTNRLWQKADHALPPEHFRALVALAAFDPQSPRWDRAAHGLIDELLKANPLHLGSWINALRPVRGALLAPLTEVFRGERLAEHRQVAAYVLADYAADRPGVLAELLLDADAKQVGLIRPVLERYREQATARMRQELTRQPDYWKDRPLDPAWKGPAEELRREVERAGGLLDERFAMCQALTLGRLQAVTEGLRHAGYRPVRVRPWSRSRAPLALARGGDGRGVRGLFVAVVWTRDGGDWKLEPGLPPAELVKAGPEGLLLADVAGYHTPDGVRYAVLWRRGAKGEQAVVHTGQTTAQLNAWAERYAREGYLPATLQGLVGPAGEVRYSAVWHKGTGKPPASSLFASDDANTYADRVLAGEQLPVDVDLGPAGQPPSWRYGSVWREETAHDAIGLHGQSAEDHLEECRKLADQGYRPVALTLAALGGQKAPMAASVWHRPALPGAERERVARRQGMAGAMLMHLGHAQEVGPLWGHRPDPTPRSYLVERVGLLRVDPRVLIQKLEKEDDPSAQRALILALGEYPEKELPVSLREPLVKKALEWYRNHPDPGIHAAIDWLLRHGREGPIPRLLDWGQRQELERIDRELARRDPDGDRGWYVNRQGQTFAILRGPMKFRMGSPPSEPDRNPDSERPHVRVIPRNYAIATKLVTVADYERFLAERPQHRCNYPKRYSPEADGPIIAVTWFDAVAYCNWLSEKEGIPRKQWCYPEKIGEGMKLFPDHLERQGYRLPTEAEWEYACRAGAVTSRSFGSSEALLPRYAWYQPNSQDRTQPVGQKRPNDLGLFDMHGNVWTWCQNAASPYPRGRAEDKEEGDNLSDLFGRALRGGSFLGLALDVRAAPRFGIRPTDRNILSFGLRVARTLP